MVIVDRDKLWKDNRCYIAFISIIINDIYRAQTSPRSKCAKSAVAQSQLSFNA